MLEFGSPNLGVVLAVALVPVAFLAGWFLQVWRGAQERADLEGRLAEQATFSKEQLDCLWQNLSDASTEVKSVRAGEAARHAEAEQRLQACQAQVHALEGVRANLLTELETIKQAHETTKAELEASAGLLEELQEQESAVRRTLDERSRALDVATERVRTLEREGTHQMEELAALRASEAQALRVQSDLSAQLRSRQDELDRMVARVSVAESAAATLEPARLRLAALEAETAAAQRAHGEVTAVLRERTARLEDALDKATSGFEAAVRERAEALQRNHHLLEELAALRVEVARRHASQEEIQALREDLAKRDALLAVLEARASGARRARPAPHAASGPAPASHATSVPAAVLAASAARATSRSRSSSAAHVGTKPRVTSAGQAAPKARVTSSHQGPVVRVSASPASTPVAAPASDAASERTAAVGIPARAAEVTPAADATSDRDVTPIGNATLLPDAVQPSDASAVSEVEAASGIALESNRAADLEVVPGQNLTCLSSAEVAALGRPASDVAAEPLTVAAPPSSDGAPDSGATAASDVPRASDRAAASNDAAISSEAAASDVTPASDATSVPLTPVPAAEPTRPRRSRSAMKTANRRVKGGSASDGVSMSSPSSAGASPRRGLPGA